MNLLSVTVGEYTVLQDEFGRVSALRYGEPWRNCVGDNLVLALAQEVQGLREKRQKEISEVCLSALVRETEAEENYQKLLEAEKVIAELRKEVRKLKAVCKFYQIGGTEL